ncbi:hypothetical protein PCI56_05525 [Plesiomonas shigelloides subsp. oncorhynchi]|nr:MULTISPECIES: hypothetical protein [Gammaproteobacteria]MDA1379313.1 hypothetical protein [Plesiomonas shigelloides]EHK7495335.1 hypothetical protein [Escherichia coli]EHU9078955.1 hypothetical protein [Escherichia coli]MBE4622664.1 hypothetical protein [Escherichia coli]MBP4004330.1 hypothetical protein [Escherichia coli]
MSAQTNVRKSESTSDSLVSWQFRVWQVMFAIGFVAGIGLELTYNFLG